jgi:spoIIIJ-associated protein
MQQPRTSVEIQAYSVDAAVELALEQLGMSRDQVDIEIPSDAGPDEGDEALVRVTARGQASQPIPGAARAARGSGGGDRAPRLPAPQGGERGERPSRRGRGPRPGRPRDGGGGSPDRLAGRSGPGDRPSLRGTPPPRATQDRVDAADEQTAKAIVRELLDRMGVDADVMAVDNPSAVPLSADDPPTIFIDIVGNDLGMLIGRRGEHLGQIQYLVNLLVNRRLGTWSRVVLDVEGYRSRREESLIGLAERVARQVARSRRPIVLEPMPPNERRIVHLTLQTHPEVTTQSSGEGNQRRITVQPRA